MESCQRKCVPIDSDRLNRVYVVGDVVNLQRLHESSASANRLSHRMRVVAHLQGALLQAVPIVFGLNLAARLEILVAWLTRDSGTRRDQWTEEANLDIQCQWTVLK
jgi:hypothetical protein